jgi:DNA-binding response OmpR family regulator
MPGLDGLEFVQRTRSARSRTYTWVIMLTGMDAGDSYRRAMEAGVDDFLTKPLDHEKLRVRLDVAERVHRMTEQVAALASVLPICMHCKQVRDESDHWKRVEEYIRDIDFSHSYCSECYYEHSLLPELLRMRSAVGETVAAEEATLDPGRGRVATTLGRDRRSGLDRVGADAARVGTRALPAPDRRRHAVRDECALGRSAPGPSRRSTSRTRAGAAAP